MVHPAVAPPTLRPEENTVTLAVTLRWNPTWALDNCEVSDVIGRVRRALADALADIDKVVGVESVLTYDPSEEYLLGNNEPIIFERKDT